MVIITKADTDHEKYSSTLSQGEYILCPFCSTKFDLKRTQFKVICHDCNVIGKRSSEVVSLFQWTKLDLREHIRLAIELLEAK